MLFITFDRRFSTTNKNAAPVTARRFLALRV
jgi:hypothetical protein